MANPREGTVLDEQYRLDRLLGVGGVGAVYAAHHLTLARDVAIKLLHPQFAGHREPLQRFLREAQLLSKLEHPSFLKVDDFSYAPDGTAYLVMELLHGETLRARLSRGPMSVEEAVAMFRPLCQALEQAHRLQILHRDLKPDNLMLVAGGVKILDFGMAKHLADENALTADKVVMGTPYYLAPERARGQSGVDHRSDIFALGAILYEVLTGQMAFAAETPLAAMYRIIQDSVAPLNLADRELSERLDKVIAKATAKKAEDRYQTAGEMLAALEEATQPKGPTRNLVNSTSVVRPANYSQSTTRSVVSTERRVKAMTVLASLDFIHSRFGEDGYQRLGQAMGIERVSRLATALPNAWVSADDLDEIHQWMIRLFGDGSMGVMREMGYHVGGVALTTTYKAFLYESGVDTFLRRAQKLFGALVQPGEFFVEEVDKGHWRQWTRGWPGLTHAMHAATVGWMVRYLELMGATDVIAHDSLLQENGDPVGYTEIQFTPPVEAAGSEI